MQDQEIKINLSEEQMKAFNELEAAMGGADAKSMSPEGTTAAAIGTSELCKIYNKAKPALDTVLPILEKIPGVQKAVPAIRALMAIADVVCAL